MVAPLTWNANEGASFAQLGHALQQDQLYEALLDRHQVVLEAWRACAEGLVPINCSAMPMRHCAVIVACPLL